MRYPGLDSPGGKQIYGDRLPRFVVCQSDSSGEKIHPSRIHPPTDYPFPAPGTYLDPFADFFQEQKRHWLFTE